MIARSIKGKFLVFSVFFLGIVTGVLMANVWQTRVMSSTIAADVKSAENAKAKRDVDKWYDYVGLSPEQRIQVTKIVNDSKPAFKKISEQVRPQMEAQQKLTRSQIQAVLTEDQNKKYDEFREAARKRQKPQPSHSN